MKNASVIRYSSSAPAIPIDPAEAPGSALVSKYVALVWRRKAVWLAFAAAGLLGALAFTIPQKPTYRAVTTLEIQNVNDNFLNMRNVSPTATGSTDGTFEADLQTQVSILQSQAIARSVIDTLNLTANLASAERDGKGRLSTQTTLERVASNLTARVRPNTRLVEVAYSSHNPALAADVANSIADEFIRQNLQAHRAATVETGQWLARQLEDTRQSLERSERALQEYARSSDLLFTGDRDSVAEAKLRQLQQELSAAQAERVAREAKLELARSRSAESLPEALDNSTLKEYQSKLTDLRRQQAELSSTLMPAHPSVRKVEAQIAALEAALAQARKLIMQRMEHEFASAKRREDLLSSNYSAQVRLVTDQAAKATSYDILKRDVENNRRTYDAMLQHVNDARLAAALRSSNVRVIDRAAQPEAPFRPNVAMNIGFGLLGGSLLGLVWIAARARTDRSIRTPGEVSLYLDAPELGVIPAARAEWTRGPRYLPRVQSKKSVELITWRNGGSAVSESFRCTLASLLYSGSEAVKTQAILVTSANPGEGKTTVASNLALAIAEIGRRVLLIDADLRRPSLHTVFGISNSDGLSNLLESDKPLDNGPLGLPAGYRDLFVLPAGPASEPSSISNRLHSPRLDALIQYARREFDTIIIDTPPMLTLPDARVVARVADGTILVVRSASTDREAVVTAGRRLSEDGTKLLGAVLNSWNPREASEAAYGRAYRNSMLDLQGERVAGAFFGSQRDLKPDHAQ